MINKLPPTAGVLGYIIETLLQYKSLRIRETFITLNFSKLKILIYLDRFYLVEYLFEERNIKF